MGKSPGEYQRSNRKGNFGMKTRETLNDNEIRDFLHGLNSTRNTLAAVLMLDAGLRVNEVCSMLRSTLLLFDGPVHTIRVAAVDSKNGESRFVPASPRIQEIIKLAKIVVWDMSNQSPDCMAIPGRTQQSSISVRQVERICIKTGLRTIGRPVNPHLLRHTFATRLMRVTSIRVVQQLLGHKQLSSTQVYTHPTSDDLTAAIDSMGKVD